MCSRLLNIYVCVVVFHLICKHYMYEICFWVINTQIITFHATPKFETTRMKSILSYHINPTKEFHLYTQMIQFFPMSHWQCHFPLGIVIAGIYHYPSIIIIIISIITTTTGSKCGRWRMIMITFQCSEYILTNLPTRSMSNVKYIVWICVGSAR